MAIIYKHLAEYHSFDELKAWGINRDLIVKDIRDGTFSFDEKVQEPVPKLKTSGRSNRKTTRAKRQPSELIVKKLVRRDTATTRAVEPKAMVKLC